MLGEGVVPRTSKPPGRNGPSSAAIAAQRLGGGRATVARKGTDPGLVARVRARLPRIRPFKLLTVSAFSIALIGIVANAMIFQRGHHPAPLFGLGHSVDGQPEPVQRSVADHSVPVPAPAVPAPLDRADLAPPPPAPPVAIDPTPRVAAAPASRPNPVHHAASKPQIDAIGGLLSSTVPKVAHPRPGVVAHRTGSTDKAAPGTDVASGSIPHGKPAAKPDHKSKSAESGTALVHAEAAHHVGTGTPAHPRPHAKPVSGKTTTSAKAEPAANPVAKPE